MRAVPDPSSRYIPWIAIGAIAAAAGLTIESSGGLILLGIVGLGTAVLFFLRPDYGLLLAAATVPVENAVIVSGFTGNKIVSIVALAAWLANRIVWKRDWSSLLISRLTVAGTLFIGFALASVLWARVPSLAFSGAVTLLQYFLWALMIADLARSPAVMTNLVRVLVLSGSLAAGITVQQFLSGARRAGDQVAGGINGTATLLVTILPLAFYLFRADRQLAWRVLGLVYVALVVVAVPATLSRMNIMLLAVVLLVMTVLTLWGRRGRGWVFAMGAAAVVAGLYAVPMDRLGERATTIGPYLQSTIGQSSESPVSSGRGFHLRVGMAIARDHPVAGVGYRNYGEYFLRDYQFTVGGSEGLYYSRRSPHSSHVGILADLGIIGFILWVVLLGVGLQYCAAAWYRAGRVGLENTGYLAQSLLVAFGLHALPYGLYLPNQMEKIFWLLLAMCFAVYQLARSSSPARASVGRQMHGVRGSAGELLVAGPSSSGRRSLASPQPLGQGGYR